MTGGELDGLMASLAEDLRRLGIPVSGSILPQVQINTRAHRRLGCCYFRGGQHVIEISAMLLDQPDKLRQTLCHELLHTCYGCKNHGERWKTYAQKVNEAWGMEIRRLSPPEEDAAPLRQDRVRYVLECQACGARILRTRLSKAVKQPWRYRCPCGGKLKAFSVDSPDQDK